MALLQIDNISINFGGLQALKNVSFAIKEGEISALIGPNGAGKTTLFNIIAGFLAPTTGKVIFEGNPIQGKPPHELAMIGVSRTFQNIRLLNEMTVLDNVRLGFHIHLKQTMLDSLLFSKRYREEEEKYREEAIKILDFMGMAQLADELARNLPYGSQRKLEIARILATGTKLMLLDEPCAGMNTAEKEALGVLISDIKNTLNRTILLIEHDMRFVTNFSRHITVLNQGEKIAEGTPEEIQKDPLVIEAYLGRGRGGRKSNA